MQGGALRRRKSLFHQLPEQGLLLLSAFIRTVVFLFLLSPAGAFQEVQDLTAIVRQAQQVLAPASASRSLGFFFASLKKSWRTAAPQVLSRICMPRMWRVYCAGSLAF